MSPLTTLSDLGPVEAVVFVAPMIGDTTVKPSALRSYQGRIDAKFAEVALSRGLRPPTVHLTTQDNPAAIAFRRALTEGDGGIPGWGNRSARRRGWLGLDISPVPTAERRLASGGRL